MSHPTTENKSLAFSWKARMKSFVFAWAGILRFFQAEHNAWIHLGATAIVAVLALVLRVSRVETIVLVFSVAFVWIAEMVNTSIEKMMDLLSPGFDPRVKVIKDMAAGAVLVAAIAAAIAGSIIFLPKIFA